MSKPAPQAARGIAPEPPATVRVRGSFIPPQGYHSPRLLDRESGKYREDPGRLSAGLWWPIGRHAEADVTPEQLEALIADEHIEILSDNGTLLSQRRPPPSVKDSDPASREDWRRKCVELEGLVRMITRERDAANLRAQDATQLASLEAERTIARMRGEYEQRIADLERDLRSLRNTSRTGWMPPPETSDEKARREAHADD